jgi:Tol biopolymer transport system component
LRWLSLVLALSILGCSSKEDPRPSKIAFVLDRQGTRSDILVVDPQGGDPVPVAAAEAEDESPAWAPDGMTLIFSSKRDGHYGLYTWDQKVTMLCGANYKDMGPTWSPNGRRIAYMSNRDNTWQIYSISAAGRDEKRLTDSNFNDTWPTWSHDGTEILFQSDRGGQQDLYVMKVLPSEADPHPKRQVGVKDVPVKVTEEPRPLTNDRAWDGRPAWSPDGKTILWPSAREGKSAIYVMDADGKNVRRLTPLDSEADEPSWAPDGKRIVFVSMVRMDGSTGKSATWALTSSTSPGGAGRLRIRAPCSAPILTAPVSKSSPRASATCRNSRSTSTAI